MIINCIDCSKEMIVIPSRVKIQRRCKSCYLLRLKGEGNPNWKGSKICTKCGKERNRSEKGKCMSCYLKELSGKAICIICGDYLSVWKNSKGYDTGICQKCYIKDNTRIWNKHLTDEERETRAYRRKKHEYVTWRKSIFEKNDYTCQKCNKKSGTYLCAHHIENYSENPEKRYDINNGVTLCVKCHKEFHKKYSLRGNNIIQLIEFMGDSKFELAI